MLGHYTTGPRGVTVAEYTKEGPDLQNGSLAVLRTRINTPAAHP